MLVKSSISLPASPIKPTVAAQLCQMLKIILAVDVMQLLSLPN